MAPLLVALLIGLSLIGYVLIDEIDAAYQRRRLPVEVAPDSEDWLVP
jgi:hypothetical protein